MVECLSSNHTLNDVSLCIEKRKPSDVLAERAFLKTGRGDWPNFEPLVREFHGAVLDAAEDRAPLLAAVAPKPLTSVQHVKPGFRPPNLTLPDCVL